MQLSEQAYHRLLKRARTLRGILPEMSLEEALDVTRIYSVAGQIPPGTLLTGKIYGTAAALE
jgi:hypothetical protein